MVELVLERRMSWRMFAKESQFRIEGGCGESACVNYTLHAVWRMARALVSGGTSSHLLVKYTVGINSDETAGRFLSRLLSFVFPRKGGYDWKSFKSEMLHKGEKGKRWLELFVFAFFVCFALFARVQLKNRSFKTETSNMHGIGWGLRPVCRLES